MCADLCPSRSTLHLSPCCSVPREAHLQSALLSRVFWLLAGFSQRGRWREEREVRAFSWLPPHWPQFSFLATAPILWPTPKVTTLASYHHTLPALTPSILEVEHPALQASPSFVGFLTPVHTSVNSSFFKLCSVKPREEPSVSCGTLFNINHLIRGRARIQSLAVCPQATRSLLSIKASNPQTCCTTGCVG